MIHLLLVNEIDVIDHATKREHMEKLELGNYNRCCNIAFQCLVSFGSRMNSCRVAAELKFHVMKLRDIYNEIKSNK